MFLSLVGNGIGAKGKGIPFLYKWALWVSKDAEFHKYKLTLVTKCP
jgi:hypothetical protein